MQKNPYSPFLVGFYAVTEDWENNFLTDVQAVDGDCPQDYEPIFQNTWMGADTFCDCSDYHRSGPYTLERGLSSCLEGKDRGTAYFAERSDDCYFYKAIDPVV